ncbi:alpha-D-mannosidase [Rhizobium rhizosphaerae]|uniref:Alpha-D-mannosidase n=1 Tax=Xaviernesmea rhizosphaerae TaxID=1672749 RepID=A0ABX3PER9_9HYPH|nr:glycoside hydrolase family 38 C-terminal domain-containing protein [Xaviernesmea rhizosphaerae]OQP86572.1 alpha-D-mannosidase [Xaviernesmea rhizosphaerae]
MKTYRDRQRSLEQLSRHMEVWADELGAFETLRRVPLGPLLARSPQGVETTLSPGDSWSDRFGVHHFTLTDPVALPEGPGIELRLDFGGETLIRLKDATGRVIDSFAGNERHKRFDAPRDVAFTIEAQSVARGLFGVPNRAPVFKEAAILHFYPQVRALRRRIEILRSTADTVKDEALSRALFEAGEVALSALRLPTATAEVGPRLATRAWTLDLWERSFEPTDTPAPLDAAALASVEVATADLDRLLADLRAAYPKHGRVLATGHAHIDYAWLWPQPETVRKIGRTFASVNSLMKKHPDFRFLQSSALYYRHIEEEDPALFEEIRARIAEGRWEAIGSMWVECDTNMPSAEAFLRQFMQGRAYFKEKFGVESRVAWLPDTFGFTGAMPQIMRHAGVDKMVTIKISWNETNRLDDNLFHWQGNDGSRVLVHMFDAYDNDGYNMLMTPAALSEVWSKHAAKDMTDAVIASYGWGDGGGGPDPDQIECMPLLNLMPAIPTIEHARIETHIETLAEAAKTAAVPVWSGELYLEYHRATLTTQGRTKQLNRRAEYGLAAAEAASVIDRLDGGETPFPALDADWQLMLRNQFHDILPGSSIREVYEQTEPELEGVVERTDAIIAERLAAIAARHAGDGPSGLLIANLSGSAKTAVQIESPHPLPEALQPQPTDDGFVTAIDRPLAPLALGFAATASARRATASLEDGIGKLENELVAVRLDAHGRIESLIEKASGRELMAGPGNRLMLYRNDLPRNFDAWDIEPGFELGEEEWLSLEGLTVTASGPHLAEITLARRHSASRIVQRMRLWSNSPRLEILTDLDWHDRRTYLRAAFPVTVHAEEAVYDQAIGVTRRATHTNTSWQRAQFEACGHRFVSLSETDWGCALLSADKYGFSARGNVMTLSLMRGPTFPDMLADEGEHRFTYAILPHDGRWWSEAVQAEADLLADPPRFVAATTSPDLTVRPVAFSGQQARFHALKPAMDGKGYVLRLSEAAGRRGPLHLDLPGTAHTVDAFEVRLEDGQPHIERPFGLASFRFGQ